MKKLNIYFTAGVPQLNDTAQIMKTIQSAGADMIEVGIPYSDPVADGPVIQKSDELALQNGMTITKLFEQLKTVKDEINIPVILMGYLNPVLKFGFEKFCQECQASGVSGLILPDLPPIEFEKKYQKILEQYGINFTFLVTPETSDERIQYLDSLSSGFLYAVSSSSTTGTNQEIDNDAYFKRLKSLNLKNPILIGFSIKNKTDFDKVTQHADGAIIGSAFVKILLENENWESKAAEFIKSIK
ncbi:tryptophan synthase subunit alpha [Elizabethkingia miricola]|uniref:Tryptophan synthase alpha chain n=1 Tax=Elizabethkingia miricola TaxID=172045 RepID=A0ABD4DRE7_ELIMR|nr:MULTISPECIES: tryptophan synthase subunit alpha [Elizabethkingia]KUY20940.1 tryptophan synthase subunit alpha [Elizabethkingia miricola]MCL1654197.1 tryptophan synthase subunit alpha [Elizabethkingia miricola]MCL1677726.1 tryptophan synthase subunit alpha [Elizabethkingia miricola]MDX8567347.1 tryptophan synthase subunit alpha [Elizabethkingia sp. HX XZB]OPC16464.1 tryptophan synthase subunit alpha [Elizabethkingia miricola]